jgi:hypothetical protein
MRRAGMRESAIALARTQWPRESCGIGWRSSCLSTPGPLAFSCSPSIGTCISGPSYRDLEERLAGRGSLSVPSRFSRRSTGRQCGRRRCRPAIWIRPADCREIPRSLATRATRLLANASQRKAALTGLLQVRLGRVESFQAS